MKYIKLFETEIDSKSLFNAVRYLGLRDIKTLLNHDADVNIRNSSGRTPLMNAVTVAKGSKSKIIKVIELLVKHGADLNIQDVDGYTALIYSAMRKKIDVIYELINLGAEWYIKDDDRLDFVDYIIMWDEDEDESTKLFDELIEKYPDKYKEYLLKKDAEKYNL